MTVIFDVTTVDEYQFVNVQHMIEELEAIIETTRDAFEAEHGENTSRWGDMPFMQAQDDFVSAMWREHFSAKEHYEYAYALARSGSESHQWQEAEEEALKSVSYEMYRAACDAVQIFLANRRPSTMTAIDRLERNREWMAWEAAAYDDLDYFTPDALASLRAGELTFDD